MNYRNAYDVYLESKASEPDVLPLIRSGDYYETFQEDAELLAKTQNLTLTRMKKGDAKSTVSCGFPFHMLRSVVDSLALEKVRVKILVIG